MERSRGAPCPLCPPKLRPVRHQDTATATSRRWSPSGGHRAVPSLWLGKGSPSPRRQEAAPGCHLRRLLTAGRRRRGGHSHEYISAGKMGSFLSWAVSTSILSGPLGHSTATRSGETKTSLAGLKRHLFPSRPRGRSQPSNASVQGTHASQSPRVRLSECVLPPQYPADGFQPQSVHWLEARARSKRAHCREEGEGPDVPTSLGPKFLTPKMEDTLIKRQLTLCMLVVCRHCAR